MEAETKLQKLSSTNVAWCHQNQHQKIKQLLCWWFAQVPEEHSSNFWLSKVEEERKPQASTSSSRLSTLQSLEMLYVFDFTKNRHKWSITPKQSEIQRPALSLGAAFPLPLPFHAMATRQNGFGWLGFDDSYLSTSRAAKQLNAKKRQARQASKRMACCCQQKSEFCTRFTPQNTCTRLLSLGFWVFFTNIFHGHEHPCLALLEPSCQRPSVGVRSLKAPILQLTEVSFRTSKRTSPWKTPSKTPSSLVELSRASIHPSPVRREESRTYQRYPAYENYTSNTQGVDFGRLLNAPRPPKDTPTKGCWILPLKDF